EALVDRLPSLTLQIFALQALIEGISLGALDYRQQVLEGAPSERADGIVRADELRHVRFSYGFMRDLVERDGVVERAAFERVTAAVYSLFEESFRPERLDAFVRHAYGISDCGVDARPSPGKRMLWSLTLRAVLKNRAAFLNHYERAVKAARGAKS